MYSKSDSNVSYSYGVDCFIAIILSYIPYFLPFCFLSNLYIVLSQ